VLRIMLPVDILVDEHKLIMRAVDLIKIETGQITTSESVNANKISAFMDFFRIYADRFHHGKEEGILFRRLKEKKLKQVDSEMMKELMLEHAFARRTVTALEKANEGYIAGKKTALREVLELLSTLVKLYPVHIEKEDKHFFYPCMEYFSPQEQKTMLNDFTSFNQSFTDKRYEAIIDSFTK
jgi:hemerythrin-like domain-containing protein